jgi:hypothetical protein
MPMEVAVEAAEQLSSSAPVACLGLSLAEAAGPDRITASMAATAVALLPAEVLAAAAVGMLMVVLEVAQAEVGWRAMAAVAWQAAAHSEKAAASLAVTVASLSAMGQPAAAAPTLAEMASATVVTAESAAVAAVAVLPAVAVVGVATRAATAGPTATELNSALAEVAVEVR